MSVSDRYESKKRIHWFSKSINASKNRSHSNIINSNDKKGDSSDEEFVFDMLEDLIDKEDDKEDDKENNDFKELKQEKDVRKENSDSILLSNDHKYNKNKLDTEKEDQMLILNNENINQSLPGNSDNEKRNIIKVCNPNANSVNPMSPTSSSKANKMTNLLSLDLRKS